MSTTNVLTFTSSTSFPVNSAGTQNQTNPAAGINYTLPSYLAGTYNESWSTYIGTSTYGGGSNYPIIGSLNVTAGLTGGFDLTLGSYKPDYPLDISFSSPSTVSDGSVFTVDPTLVSSNDANFSLTGLGLSLNLELGVQGNFSFSFNRTSSFGLSINVNPSWNFGYTIPSSLTLSSSSLPGVSLTFSEPSSFQTTSGGGSVVTGSIPTLTATGTDNPPIASGTIDFVALAISLLSKIPGLEELSVVDGSYGFSGATLNYSLLSVPLTGNLYLGEGLTLTPEPIQVSITDQLNGQTDTGTLGENFSFTAPLTGSGTIPLLTSYTLPLEVTTNTGVTGELLLSIEGPQINGSVLHAGFTLGPLGSYQVFDLSSGLGTIATSNFTQSLTTSETYDVDYGGTACYVAGTRILTDQGLVAIERLNVDDVVVTASGARRPVRWLGSRRIDCTRHPDPAHVWPICIEAGAFGEGTPARDLWVSPGHAMLIDGALIQAYQLVNGATIRQVRRPRVEYWHLELDAHDCVLAEGLASESYLDTGNRTAFVNGGEFLEAYPDFQPKHFRDTCVPLVTEGPAIAQAKTALIARAQALGYRITEDMDLHVKADGLKIEPMRLAEKRWAFALPEAAGDIELCCAGFVPAHTHPESGDMRTLGVCVRELQLDGVAVALDDAAVFGEGWHRLERVADGVVQRWTTERARLPKGTRLVVMTLVGRNRRWLKPATDSVVRLALPQAG